MVEYYLSVEKQRNDFIPFNHLMGNYPNEYLYDLEIIDHFTQRFENEEELKKLLAATNIFSDDELTCSLAIYYKDGKKRKQEDGIIYKEDSKYIDPEKFKKLLTDVRSNKDLLNRIVCKFRNNNLFKTPSIPYTLFNEQLLNISGLPNDQLFILDLIAYMEYKERRAIGLFVKSETTRLEKELEQKEISNIREFTPRGQKLTKEIHLEHTDDTIAA